MELSLICPAEHVEMTELLSGRFCIASTAMQDARYRRYFRNDTTHRVILDNGVFENDLISDSDYDTLIEEIKPSVVIVPDILCGNAHDNWKQAVAFATRFKLKEKYKNIKLMFVPQTKRDDTEGFGLTLVRAIDSKLFDAIGICRDAVYNAYGKYTQTEDQELNRLYFAAQATFRGFVERAARNATQWHFLGIGDRIDLIQYYWFVDSMDTASLFYQGYNGAQIDNGTLKTRVKRPPDYFTRHYTDLKEGGTWQLEAIKNIKNNCIDAQNYADKATALRNRLQNGRL